MKIEFTLDRNIDCGILVEGGCSNDDELDSGLVGSSTLLTTCI